MSRSMRLGIRLLCLVLLGHWWHALAMPYAVGAVSHTMQPSMTHQSTVHLPTPAVQATPAHNGDHLSASDTCCDTPFAAEGRGTDPQPDDKHSAYTSCGTGHVCCTLQATPWLTTPLTLLLTASNARHTHDPQWVLQRHSERLFKPPKA